MKHITIKESISGIKDGKDVLKTLVEEYKNKNYE